MHHFQKKEANKNRHHNCGCNDAAVAEALFKTAASRNHNMIRMTSHDTTVTARPSLDRDETIESASECGKLSKSFLIKIGTTAKR